ncbi:MAG TPA: hypothetical protein VNM90_04265 [Haliangium sp.]|nr:hypothetical protein [Haliangium sp.]
MKCIRCGHDSKFKDREGNQCPACKKLFAFEPKTGDKFTDQAFKNAIDRVSSNGSVKFSERNLFYEVDRLRARPGAGSWPAALGWMVLGLVSILVAFAGPGFLVGVGIVLIIVAVAQIPRRGAKHVKLLWSDFQAAYGRWRAVHGEPRGVFSAKPTKKLGAGPQADAMRAELAQYSFDRAVITDTAATADLLLANDFHFENNCAVLSVDGHPAHAFDTVREMLRNNPKIEVFALHDCTPGGCELAWTLKRDPAWFKDIGQVFDVALRPAQARKMKASWQAGSGIVAEHPALTEDERTFLAENTVELAAIRPEQLIKRLFRAMTLLPAAAGSGGDGGGSDGTMVWTTEAHASDGGGDAFG